MIRRLLNRDGFPLYVVDVPHLGLLTLTCHDDFVVFNTYRSYLHEKLGLTAEEVLQHVTINGVDYTVALSVYPGDSDQYSVRYNRIATTDGRWVTAPDCLGTERPDRVRAAKHQISDSARSKLLKRVMLFMEDFSKTDDFERLLTDARDTKRDKAIEDLRTRIASTRKQLATMEQSLAKMLGQDIDDLIALRHAFENESSLNDALEGE